MRNNKLAEELKVEGGVNELHTIGDCNIPRTMKEVFEEVVIVARRI